MGAVTITFNSIAGIELRLPQRKARPHRSLLDVLARGRGTWWSEARCSLAVWAADDLAVGTGAQTSGARRRRKRGRGGGEGRGGGGTLEPQPPRSPGTEARWGASQGVLPANHHADHPGFAGLSAVIVGLILLVKGRPNARLAADIAGVSAADRVVDIGCGPGGAVREAARRGACATGVDPPR